FRAARKGETVQKPSLRLIAATSLAGVRGAITLAGVLTIPFLVADGSAFPARTLIIFLATAVIVVSLLLASIGLPFLLKDLKLPPEPKALAEEDSARAASAEAAIEAIEQLQKALKIGKADTELYAEASARVMETYRRRIDSQGKSGEASRQLRHLEKIERDLRLAGLRAEREVFYELSRSKALSDETARKLVREADLLEARLTAS
ncbi:MAG TPA: Na+/H+ antiporter, partial [Asticcacaulis sp.]|nr:Na+/H+ antiporter [Asticcacaulis sp.]